MAKVDLKYPVYAPATETDSAISYGTGAVLAKAISADIAIETNDVKLYADGILAESDQSFKSGTIKIGVDELLDAAKVALLDYIEGSVVDVSLGTKELSAIGAASPAYVGFGCYGKIIRNKIAYYRAVWLKKVQFAEPNDSLKTKGETLEFGTSELEGEIMIDITGVWKEEARFSTEPLAKAWLEGKANITAKAANVASSVASGTYAGNKNITLTTAEAAGTIYYTDDGTIPSATNGTEYTAAIELTAPENVCIKAVCVAAGKANSDILELYITLTA